MLVGVGHCLAPRGQVRKLWVAVKQMESRALCELHLLLSSSSKRPRPRRRLAFAVAVADGLAHRLASVVGRCVREGEAPAAHAGSSLFADAASGTPCGR